ncbi:hypothetical protein [Camelimonas lactis]|uniref:Uncharacterized protein n=1 Tax=Camelimonas lactis TaxID=659006 RepID=A0A4R2GWI0_9HYPH|nr:hypothetical protein [Camelimonas lactis]TCO15196.1 hypothetical protein EV666_102174 [Camelimonas lactis]
MSMRPLTYAEKDLEDARLAILNELSKQTGGAMSVEQLVTALGDWGHRKSDAAVEQLLNDLVQVQAVQMFQTHARLLAQITRDGLNHVAGRQKLARVKGPFSTD